jgi:hypothetical protein
MPQRELAGPCAETCPDCRKDTCAIFDTVPQCHTWAWGQQHTCCPTGGTSKGHRCPILLRWHTMSHIPPLPRADVLGSSL